MLLPKKPFHIRITIIDCIMTYIIYDALFPFDDKVDQIKKIGIVTVLMLVQKNQN